MSTPVFACFTDTSSSGRARPSDGKIVFPPPRTIGSSMSWYSSTRSFSTSWRASDALPQTCRPPSPPLARSERIASIVLPSPPPRSVVLFHLDDDSSADSVRDTTYFGMAFIWSAYGSPARPGQAPAMTSHVRRPNSNASVRSMTSPMTAPIESGSKNGADQPPCWNSPSVSSSGPPGACTTPSRLMKSLRMIRMSGWTTQRHRTHRKIEADPLVWLLRGGDPVQGERIVHPTHHSHTDLFDGDSLVGRGLGDRLGEEDLAGHCRAHDAGSDVHCAAQIVPGPVQRRPRVDANADRRQVGIASELRLRCDSKSHGSGRIAEGEHEPVADLLHELSLVFDEQGAHDHIDAVEHTDCGVVTARFRERRKRGDVDESDRRLDRAELPGLRLRVGEMEEGVLHHRLEQVSAMQPLEHRVHERSEVLLDAGDQLLHLLRGRARRQQPFMDVHVDDADLGLGDASERVAKDAGDTKDRLPRQSGLVRRPKDLEDRGV